jgi:glucose-6-phosphate isomerase
MSKLTESRQWNELKEHHFNIKHLQMKEIFHYDEDRFEKYSIKWNDILFDYSKNRINWDTIANFLELAKFQRLRFKIDDLFSGKIVNKTENRAALHTALRDPNPTENYKGIGFEENIVKTLEKMEVLTKSILNGQWKGHRGTQIKNVVNIGIGGSDLGPKFVCESLKEYHTELTLYFVSNIDRRDINRVLLELNPEETIFIITSKSFKTQETLQNAITAKNWLHRSGVSSEDMNKHFIAVSSNVRACNEFGINSDNIFEMWDSIGGRYSLWSAVGLPISLQIGWNNFKKLLKGANKIDKHFKETSYESNIPVIMAFLDIWYSNFYHTNGRAVISYNYNMHSFSDYLQQLEMESNGKSVTEKGNKVDYNTKNIVFGGVGTNSQHSFFQLLHQGTTFIPVDFIAVVDYDKNDNHNQKLLSNLLAQSRALMIGKNKQEVREELIKKGFNEKEIEDLLAHKVFEGNRPSNTILIKTLTPENLGALIAIYEHKTFVESVLLGINAFDQWGVELGKDMADEILEDLYLDEDISKYDSSTNSLINWIKE